MNKIASFQIDHRRLNRGVYVSRRDLLGQETVTTFDLRLKAPNTEPALSPAVAHTIEHLGATFLRNHPEWRARILYFGPMGCLTGFYLLMAGGYQARDIVPLVRELVAFVADYAGAVPGATPVECGNYRLMDLAAAKLEAQKYLDEVLHGLDDRQLVYPE